MAVSLGTAMRCEALPVRCSPVLRPAPVGGECVLTGIISNEGCRTSNIKTHAHVRRIVLLWVLMQDIIGSSTDRWAVIKCNATGWTVVRAFSWSQNAI